jgi:hypothetical protein
MKMVNKTMMVIFVNTALSSFTYEFGYNKELFKKLKHTDDKGNEIDVRYYYNDIREKILEIKNSLKYNIVGNIAFFKYKNNVFEIEIKGDFATSKSGNILVPTKDSKLFMKKLLSNILNVAVKSININISKYENGSRIYPALYKTMNWNLTDKEFWRKYF